MQADLIAPETSSPTSIVSTPSADLDDSETLTQDEISQDDSSSVDLNDSDSETDIQKRKTSSTKLKDNPDFLLFQCDACHAFPLQKMRFKCQVCDDFDLCSKCFVSAIMMHEPDHLRSMKKIKIEETE